MLDRPATMLATPKRAGRHAWRVLRSRAPGRRELRTATRSVAAAAISWQACVWLGISDRPGTALIPALILMRDDPFATGTLALRRAAGILTGVLVAVFFIGRDLPSFLAVVLTLGCAFAVGWLIRYKDEPNQQVPVSAVLVLATPSTAYPQLRLLENSVGIAVCLGLAPLLLPADPRSALDALLHRYRCSLAEAVDRIADALVAPAPVQPPQTTAELWATPAALRADVRTAVAGLRWNPLRRVDRPALKNLDRRIALAESTAVSLRYFTYACVVGDIIERTAQEKHALAELAPVLRAVHAALDSALAGGPDPATVEAARRALADHRRCHPQPLVISMRKGLHHTFLEVEAFRGPCGGFPPRVGGNRQSHPG